MDINLGKVALTPKGEHDSTITYDKLDIVNYRGSSYIAKKNVPTNINIDNTEYWQLIAKIPNLTIGDIDTVSFNTRASATITRTEDNLKLNLKIPRGETGNETINDLANEGDDDLVWSANKNYFETTKKVIGNNITSTLTIPGGLIYSNGADKNTTFFINSYKRSDYIEVFKGDTLVFENAYSGNSYCILAYYDSDKIYDSTFSIEGIGKASQCGVITFDANGFIRISSSNESLNTATFIIYNQIGKQFFQTKNEESILHKNATKNNFLLLNIEEIKKNKTQYIDPDTGKVLVTSSRAIGTSDFFPCCSGDKLNYKLAIDNNFPILATYDNNLQLVRIPIIGTGPQNYIEGNYIFQSDEKFFRVSVNYNYSAPEYLKYETTTTVFNEIEERLTNLESGNILLPSYWKTYLDSKIPTLQDIECDLGNKGIEFAFITDTHTPVNQMYSPYILKYLYNRMNFPYVINGGDTLDTSPTKADALNRLYTWKQAMKGLPEFCVLGNHDKNSLDQNEQSAVLTSSQFYRIMNSNMEDNKFANFSTSVSSNNIYYLIDNPEQKFRIIVLSTSFGYSSSPLEKSWFKEKLTELDSTWNILVVTHYMWHVVPDLHAVGQSILTAINEVYPQIQAKFVGVLAGHSHADYSIQEPTYHYNIIATICDGMRSGTTYDRTIGTTSEQAFDLVFIDTSENRTMKLVRIGAGDNIVGEGTGIRTFTF